MGIRIAHLTCDDRGGPATVITNLINTYRDRLQGKPSFVHEVIISAVSNESGETWLSRRLDSQLWKSPQHGKFSMLRWLVTNRDRYDVMYAHKTSWAFWGAVFVVVACLLRWRRPVIIGIMHDVAIWQGPQSFRTKVIQQLFYRLDGWVLVGPGMRRQVSPRFMSRVPTWDIANGIQPTRFLNDTLIDVGALTFVTLSRLDDEKKDIGTILSGLALANLRSRLLLVGGDGSFRRVWENRAITKGYGWVRFCGEVSDVRKFLDHGQVFIFSSRYFEGLPMVVLEAMSRGLVCIIGSSFGDFSWAEDLALFFNPGDPKDLARVVDQLCAMPPQEISSLVRRAAEYVRENFSTVKQLERYESLASEQIRLRGSGVQR